MAIGTNIYKLRKARSISQIAVAEAVGVHQTHISSIERGEKTPSLDVAQLLAQYFNVSLDDLLKEDTERELA